MWKGLYNHMEKSMPPRQSPVDFLSAMREESQQLEEELTNHQEVPPGGTAHHHHLGSRQGIQHTKTHPLLYHHNPIQSPSLLNGSENLSLRCHLNERLNTTVLSDSPTEIMQSFPHHLSKLNSVSGPICAFI